MNTGRTINNDLVISSGATFIAGAFTHNVGGNWSNGGTFTAGTGTITFNGNSSSKTIFGNLNGTNKINNVFFTGAAPYLFSKFAKLAGRFCVTNGTVTPHT